MKIYLDIDETLLINDPNNRRPAPYLKEFLTNIINNHQAYWLTTHCMDGDATVPTYFLGRFVDQDIKDLLIKIRPTKWSKFKIEAIDLTEDFMWFDDMLFSEEEKILRDAGKLDSHIKVDLQKNPNFLKDYLNI